MPKSRLRQLIKFIRVFGIAAGIRLWLSLLIQTDFRSGLIQLQLVPHLPAPIQLRRQDLPIFWQIMVMKENDFQSLTAGQPRRGYVQEDARRGKSPRHR